ncbi:hypothetical protein ACIBL5_20340 [Streptomyces sp. NPDC050516]|uniref:hypothetical protein n=1 Tax=Streptomyces sp. NPDC050516 TaxID=3365621 RepID=UPI00379F7A0D
MTDTVTEQRGELRAISPDLTAQPVAWLRPVGGGREWTTSLCCLADPEPGTPDMDPPEGHRPARTRRSRPPSTAGPTRIGPNYRQRVKDGEGSCAAIDAVDRRLRRTAQKQTGARAEASQ